MPRFTFEFDAFACQLGSITIEAPCLEDAKAEVLQVSRQALHGAIQEDGEHLTGHRAYAWSCEDEETDGDCEIPLLTENDDLHTLWATEKQHKLLVAATQQLLSTMETPRSRKAAAAWDALRALV